MSFYSWRPYVPVAERRAKARKQLDKLRKKGKDIQPIELDGRKIAASFWGKGWCDHLESFSDFENRLPRGRTYVRNGSVCHLEIQARRIEAFVSGSELYKVTIEIKPLARKTWDAIKTKCQGQIGSVLELLQGRLSDHVMEVVSDRTHGLFPQPGEIELKCSCPDWATMCKHVAAVLYGVGSRLDHRPELLFVLRGVDAEELISADMALPTGTAVVATDALAESGLAEIFGIDIETGDAPHPRKARKTKTAQPRALPQNGQAAPLPKKRAARTRATNSAKGTKTKSKKPRAQKTRPRVFDPKTPTGAAIVLLRKQAGLSVADFADSLGVSAPSVLRWEDTPGPLRLHARPLAALTRMQEEFSSR
jgi:uncharacterized Zn finger protein